MLKPPLADLVSVGCADFRYDGARYSGVDAGVCFVALLFLLVCHNVFSIPKNNPRFKAGVICLNRFRNESGQTRIIGLVHDGSQRSKRCLQS